MLTNTEKRMLHRVSELLLKHMDARRRRQHGDLYVESNPTSPHHINQGDCFNWALIVYFVIGAERCQLWGTLHQGTHAFVCIDGVFHDSDSVDEGKGCWKEMHDWFPVYTVDEVNTSTFDNFVHHWRHYGASDIHLDLWTAMADQVKHEFEMAEAA